MQLLQARDRQVLSGTFPGYAGGLLCGRPAVEGGRSPADSRGLKR